MLGVCVCVPCLLISHDCSRTPADLADSNTCVRAPTVVVCTKYTPPTILRDCTGWKYHTLAHTVAHVQRCGAPEFSCRCMAEPGIRYTSARRSACSSYASFYGACGRRNTLVLTSSPETTILFGRWIGDSRRSMVMFVCFFFFSLTPPLTSSSGA